MWNGYKENKCVVDLIDSKCYREIIGSLIYMSLFFQPYIYLSVFTLTQYL